MGLLLTTALATVCAAASAQTEPAENRLPAQQSAVQPIDWIAASVNGEAIAWSEARLEMLIEQLPLQDMEARRQTLERLINQRIILQSAREFVLIAEWQLDREFQRQKTLLQPFIAAGAEPEELRERLRNQMIAEEFLQRRIVRALPPIDEERVQKQFNENPGRYASSAGYRLDIVDVELPAQANEEQRQSALKWIETIRNDPSGNAITDAPPEPLAVTAAFANEAPNRWIDAAGVAPELAAALETLQTGEWSEPIVTLIGYSVMRIAERREAGPLLLDERAKQTIRIELATLDWIENEKRRAVIWTLDASAAEELKPAEASDETEEAEKEKEPTHPR